MWGLYVRKRGTLNLGMRQEFLMARQAMLTVRGYAKEPDKVTTQTFLRFHEEDKPEPKEMNQALLAQQFAAMSSNPKGRGK